MSQAIPMQDAEWWGWHLALQVLPEIGVRLSIDQADRMWDVVHEIAEGRLTLVSSPAEITNLFPKANAEWVERFAQGANRHVAKERDVAQRLLRTMDEVFGENNKPDSE